jgi:Domain of unknown function (DUF4129)
VSILQAPLPTAASPDSLRAILDSVFAGQAYEWAEHPHPLAFLIRWWYAFKHWLVGLEQTQPTLYWAIVWILTAILAAIVVHALWVMARTLKAAGAPDEGREPRSTPEIRGAAWYRREAQRLAREGRYPEAMQADFLGLVLELDQRGVLKFHPSKTPNEYTCEVVGAEPARGAFGDLVRLLYGFAFAGRPCGRDDFAAWHERSQAERYAAAH